MKTALIVAILCMATYAFATTPGTKVSELTAINKSPSENSTLMILDGLESNASKRNKKITVGKMFTNRTFTTPSFSDGFTVRDIWLAPKNATTNASCTRFRLNTTGSVTGIIQPDYPRNVIFKVTDNAWPRITAMTIRVNGTLANGNATNFVETFTGTNNQTGKKPFARIESIKVVTLTGGNITDWLEMGYGLRFGLSNRIATKGAIYRVNIGGQYNSTGNQTIDVQNQTIQFKAAPNWSRNYEIWYRIGR